MGDPNRLRDLPEDGSTAAALGRLVRTANASLRGPTAAGLARIEAEVESRNRRSLPSRWLASPAMLFLFVAGTAMAGTWGVQIAVTFYRDDAPAVLELPDPLPEPAPGHESVGPRPAPAPAAPEPVSPAPAPAATLPAPRAAPAMADQPPVAARAEPDRQVAGAPSGPAPQQPEPIVAVAPPPPPLVEPPRAEEPRESRLAVESRLLAHALRLLRQEGNAAGALSSLDRLRHDYPDGALAEEVSFARVDALLALGRSDEALAEAERLAARLPEGSVRRSQLKLLQGELLAGAGRFAEALPLFDALVSGGGATLERALFGRATARSRVGDLAGSREDLLRYLSLFPRGPSAQRARAELSR